VTDGSPRPLAGRTVVVTRPRHQAGPVVACLADLGAEVVGLPLIDIDEPADGGAGLAAAVDRLGAGRYQWVVVTSANAAHRFVAALQAARRDGNPADQLGGAPANQLGGAPADQLGGAWVCVVGPATGAVLEAAGVGVAAVAERQVAEGVVEVFDRLDPPVPTSPDGSPPAVLLPQAAATREVIAPALRARGWLVDEVEAYRTVPVAVDDAGRQVLASADAVTFSSSSAVDQFVAAVGTQGAPAVVACIGPITAETARSHGLGGVVVATDPSPASLAAAVAAALA